MSTPSRFRLHSWWILTALVCILAIAVRGQAPDSAHDKASAQNKASAQDKAATQDQAAVQDKAPSKDKARDAAPVVTSAQLFAVAPLAHWLAEGPVAQVPWKIRTYSHGLSLHQRLVEHIEVEVHGRELAKRAGNGKLILLVQVTDAQGHDFRDHGALDLGQIKPEMRKRSITWSWEAFALPGEYSVMIALYDTGTHEHDLALTRIKVEPLKNDPLPEMWRGLPTWEFWAPLDETDLLFHPDTDGRLHLAPSTKRPVHLEILADLTPSDLFHGSTRFYAHYLAVVVPLMKALSQVDPAGGTVNISTVDLRRRKVTFEQDSNPNRELDWPKIKSVIAPENGPATIDAQVLQQKHETPDFLRDEFLRRLKEPPAKPPDSATPPGLVTRPDSAKASGSATPPDSAKSSGSARTPGQVRPLRVFVVIGSPMDFYSFHSMPPIEDAPGEEECLVYYLQYELYNPSYASGALNEVRKLLKPLPVHTMKVRSPESVRHALARVMEDISRM